MCKKYNVIPRWNACPLPKVDKIPVDSPVRRANEGGPLVGSLLVLGRHTKVSQTDGAVRTEENIAGLEVSVDTAIGVKEVEGGEQLL